MPDSPNEPLVLDIASLPREQIGPFLLLGVDKDADNKEIEAHWALRLIWARGKQIRIQLEDINWAKETLLDRDRRVLADVTSFNADTLNGELKQLLEKHGPLEPEEPRWRPVEAPLPELPPLTSEMLPADVAMEAPPAMPNIPLVFPAAERALAELTSKPLDPWSIEAPAAPAETA